MCTVMEISSALTALSMTRPKDIRDAYRRYAEACLAVLGRTANPTSQAMLTAMAHTWLRLADSGLVVDRMNTEPYRRNVDDAHRRASQAEPQIRALWLQLADSWFRLLGSDEKPCQSRLSKVVRPLGRPYSLH
jgi:hypothetical protein